MCMTQRLEEKLEVAETLTVLRYVATEQHNPLSLEENESSSIKQSRKMVKQALDQFMKKCEKELKSSLEKDKNSELNRVFQVY